MAYDPTQGELLPFAEVARLTREALIAYGIPVEGPMAPARTVQVNHLMNVWIAHKAFPTLPITWLAERYINGGRLSPEEWVIWEPYFQ